MLKASQNSSEITQLSQKWMKNSSFGLYLLFMLKVSHALDMDTMILM